MTPPIVPLMVAVDGELRSIAEWAKRLGCKRQTVYNRINHGWHPTRAVTTPVREHTRGPKLPCLHPDGCTDTRHCKQLCHRHYHEKKRRERRGETVE